MSAPHKDDPHRDLAPSFDWALLVAQLIHPMRVEIIEAMLWVGEPLSASDVMQILFERDSVSAVSYHVSALAKLKAIREVERRTVRGATETFYTLDASHLLNSGDNP